MRDLMDLELSFRRLSDEPEEEGEGDILENGDGELEGVEEDDEFGEDGANEV